MTISANNLQDVHKNIMTDTFTFRPVTEPDHYHKTHGGLLPDSLQRADTLKLRKSMAVLKNHLSVQHS